MIYIEFDNGYAREASAKAWTGNNFTKYKWEFIERNGKSLLAIPEEELMLLTRVTDKEYTIYKEKPMEYFEEKDDA